MKEIKGSAVLIILTLALVCFFGGFLLGSSRQGTQVQLTTERSVTLAPSSTTVTQTAEETQEEVDGEVQFPININTAGKKALMELPGIGEAYAQRIIDHRETYGPFAEIEDIMEVSGIGEKRFANMKDYITVEDANEDTGS